MIVHEISTSVYGYLLSDTSSRERRSTTTILSRHAFETLWCVCESGNTSHRGAKVAASTMVQCTFLLKLTRDCHTVRLLWQ